jgi:hypothetical protein
MFVDAPHVGGHETAGRPFLLFSFNLSFLSYQEKVAFLDHYSIKIIPTYYKVLLS